MQTPALGQSTFVRHVGSRSRLLLLKDNGYKEGSLNSRIDSASKDHLITAEMAAWAHEIRLEAND